MKNCYKVKENLIKNPNNPLICKWIKYVMILKKTPQRFSKLLRRFSLTFQ
jgi:hypothetical protein